MNVEGARLQAPGSGLRASPISIADTFRDRTLLLFGATGFVGKVLLAMTLARFPELKRLIIQVRRKGSVSGADRFYTDIITAPPLRPTCEALGVEQVRRKITIVEGDLSEPLCGLKPAEIDALRGAVDAIVNVAGLVDFNPPLPDSLASNVYGIQHLIALAQALGTRVVHVSTSFVAGRRTGRVSESTPIVGYYPGRQGPEDRRFNVLDEIAWCERTIEAVRRTADNPEAAATYASAPAASTDRVPKVGTRRWIDWELTRQGTARAESWGWMNTYTYTKSMGEQLLDSTPGLRFTIVRPAIIESAMRFPFPGWNEGLTTSAPLILIGGAGVKNWPVREDAALEIIPVDLVTAGILLATAMLLTGRQAPVYQLATADVNPVMLERLVAFVGMYARRIHKHIKSGNRVAKWWRTYVETRAVTENELRAHRARLHRGLDLYKGFLNVAARVTGKRVVGPYQKSLRSTLRQIAIQEQTLDKFLPFMLNSFVFETGNIRAAYALVDPGDRRRLLWDPENIDWADYWVNIHVKGIEKWVRPQFLKTKGAKEAGLA